MKKLILLLACVICVNAHAQEKWQYNGGHVSPNIGSKNYYKTDADSGAYSFGRPVLIDFDTLHFNKRLMTWSAFDSIIQTLSFTESDPIFTASDAYGITSTNISNWNSAYSAIHNPITIGTANGLSLSTQVLSLATANTSTTGALTATDWNTFNGKQNAITGLTNYHLTNYNSGFVSSALIDSAGILFYPDGIKINTNSGTRKYEIGDLDGIHGGDKITIDDIGQTITIDAVTTIIEGGDLLIDNYSGLGNKIAYIDNSGKLKETTIDTGSLLKSVSGTSNRITSSGGANPVIDIASTYVGQSSITTLGTITTGTWHGSAISNSYLANSTISGVSLGGTLYGITAGWGFFGSMYNGSADRLWYIDTTSSGITTKKWHQKGVDSLSYLISLRQLQLNGTGLVRMSGTSVSYDNNTYLTGNQTITASGDATGSGATSIALTIASHAVTYSKFQQVPSNKLLGNPSGSTANVSEISLGNGLGFNGSAMYSLWTHSTTPLSNEELYPNTSDAGSFVSIDLSEMAQKQKSVVIDPSGGVYAIGEDDYRVINATQSSTLQVNLPDPSDYHNRVLIFRCAAQESQIEFTDATGHVNHSVVLNIDGSGSQVFIDGIGAVTAPTYKDNGYYCTIQSVYITSLSAWYWLVIDNDVSNY